MDNRAPRCPRRFSQGRIALVARLQTRLREIEEAALARVFAISTPDESINPEYIAGLRHAVSTALRYGLVAIEHGERNVPGVPPILLAQARLAARNGVALDAVLHRYMVGYTLLSNFITQEAGHEGLLGVDDVQRLNRDQTAVFERLLVAITDEYKAEARSRRRLTTDRRFDRIRALLAGDLLDTTEFSYDFEMWHIGVLAIGSSANDVLRDFARMRDCRLLLTRSKSGVVWAWFGRRQKLTSAEFENAASARSPSRAILAIGEPGHLLPGWRLTHRQARAAFPLAMEGPRRIIRYRDEALHASIVQDDLLVASLRQLYLVPLADESDGGEILRRTLRAYFAAKGNVSSAAAALEVSRKTVDKRLALVEKIIDQPLDSCAAEVEAAIRLHDLRLHPLPAGSQFE